MITELNGHSLGQIQSMVAEANRNGNPITVDDVKGSLKGELEAILPEFQARERDVTINDLVALQVMPSASTDNTPMVILPNGQIAYPARILDGLNVKPYYGVTMWHAICVRERRKGASAFFLPLGIDSIEYRVRDYLKSSAASLRARADEMQAAATAKAGRERVPRKSRSLRKEAEGLERKADGSFVWPTEIDEVDSAFGKGIPVYIRQGDGSCVLAAETDMVEDPSTVVIQTSPGIEPGDIWHPNGVKAGRKGFKATPKKVVVNITCFWKKFGHGRDAKIQGIYLGKPLVLSTKTRGIDPMKFAGASSKNFKVEILEEGLGIFVGRVIGLAKDKNAGGTDSLLEEALEGGVQSAEERKLSAAVEEEPEAPSAVESANEAVEEAPTEEVPEAAEVAPETEDAKEEAQEEPTKAAPAE